MYACSSMEGHNKGFSLDEGEKRIRVEKQESFHRSILTLIDTLDHFRHQEVSKGSLQCVKSTLDHLIASILYQSTSISGQNENLVNAQKSYEYLEQAIDLLECQPTQREAVIRKLTQAYSCLTSFYIENN